TKSVATGDPWRRLGLISTGMEAAEASEKPEAPLSGFAGTLLPGRTGGIGTTAAALFSAEGAPGESDRGARARALTPAADASPSSPSRFECGLAGRSADATLVTRSALAGSPARAEESGPLAIAAAS